MPLWAPFVLIASTYWFSRFLLMRSHGTDPVMVDGNKTSVTPGSVFIFLLIGCMSLFIIWVNIYASAAWIVDPRWLLMLLNDLLLLNGNFFHLLGLVALSVYLCWRGIRLSRRTIEPLDVFRALCPGLGLIIVIVLLGVGAGRKLTDGPILLMLIPLMLSFALSAHALSQALFVRHSSLPGAAREYRRSGTCSICRDRNHWCATVADCLRCWLLYQPCFSSGATASIGTTGYRLRLDDQHSGIFGHIFTIPPFLAGLTATSSNTTSPNSWPSASRCAIEDFIHPGRHRRQYLWQSPCSK